MAGGKERAFLARLLRESVLTLCRETMHSHRRLIIDGIVCISLDDDMSGDDCSPIVVTIHEQLPKARDSGYSSSPQRLGSPPSDPSTPALCPSKPLESEMERRHCVPMDKKTRILSHFKQVQAELNSSTSSVPQMAVQLDRSVSEPLESKLPGGQEEGAADGHLSDPTPLSGHHQQSRQSFSSDGGISADRGVEGLWRASLSSPESSDLSCSSPSHEDVSLVGRPGSASPQDDLSALPHSRPFRPSRHLLRTFCHSLRGEGLSCQVCGLGQPNALSLQRHHRQKHSLFTCLQCLATFTSTAALSGHARLHVQHKSNRRHSCNSHATIMSRRDSRQRQMYMYMAQPRLQSRQNEICQLCSFVGKHQGDLKRHLLTHMRNGLSGSCSYTLAAHTSGSSYMCSPCGLTFSDPVMYTAHVKCHSQDVDFQQYRCCYCPAMLQTYQSFRVHQQAHALQLPQLYEDRQYPRQTQTMGHLQQHNLTYSERPEDADRHSQSEDNVPKNMEKKSSKEEELKNKDSSKVNGEGPMEQETSSGPRQSWCTECHVGFPDEDTLIQHITDMHEAFMCKRQLDQQVERSAADLEDSKNKSMDISENAVRKRSAADNGNTCESGAELNKMDQAEESGVQMSTSEEDGITEVLAEKSDSQENRGTLQSLPLRLEAMERGNSDQSLHDADSSAADSLSSSMRSSPLRVIPLPIAMDESRSPGASSKPRSLITLVKPKDLIIRTEPYGAVPSSFLVKSLPLPYTTSGEDLSIASSKRPPIRTMYSLLSGSLQSASFIRRSEHELTSIKHEPALDRDSPHFCEITGIPLPMNLSPHDSLGLSYCDSETTLDLSMPRARSSSPRSTSTPGSEGASSFKSGKGATPEVLFHARPPPLQCPMQDCCEEFQSFAELEEHSARVHRRYLCSYCGKSFTAKPNRDRHVRTHTGVKPYKCQLCPQAFYRGDDLKYHVTTKHPRDSDI